MIHRPQISMTLLFLIGGVFCITGCGVKAPPLAKDPDLPAIEWINTTPTPSPTSK